MTFHRENLPRQGVCLRRRGFTLDALHPKADLSTIRLRLLPQHDRLGPYFDGPVFATRDDACPVRTPLGGETRPAVSIGALLQPPALGIDQLDLTLSGGHKEKVTPDRRGLGSAATSTLATSASKTC